MAKRGPKPKIGTMRPVDGPAPNNDLVYREKGNPTDVVEPKPKETFDKLVSQLQPFAPLDEETKNALCGTGPVVDTSTTNEPKKTTFDKVVDDFERTALKLGDCVLAQLESVRLALIVDIEGLATQEQYQLAQKYIENARTAYRNGNLANGR